MEFYKDFSEKGKTYFRYGMMIMALGAIAALFALAFSYIADAKEKLWFRINTSQISITGEGKVAAKPDVAILTATILTERPTVSQAQSQNTESSNAVAEFLSKEGVQAKDIKTITYSIYPQYFYAQNKKPEITGYQVRNTLEIKIRDLAKVDDIVGGVVQNGANEIGGVSFTIENPNKLKEEARKLAIAMAKEKAEVLSKDLGVRLKRIIGFSENDAGIPPPIYYGKAQEFNVAGGYGGGGPELQQGEQEVKVFVTVTYELRPW